MATTQPFQAIESLHTTTARLPAAYEAAKTALANCASIDECQQWANKAQALASYARQAEDDSLQKQAMRIQSRAVRRCGELLKEFDGTGRNQHEASKVGLTSQREAAEGAGMSLHQERTAVRVANVPEKLFDEVVESDTPPTVTKLADWGRKPNAKPDWAEEMQKATPKPGWRAFITLRGLIRQLAEVAKENEASVVADAVEEHERREMRSHIAQVRRWLKQIAPELRS